MSKGKLVRVQLQKGQFVKMYEADAIAKGLLPPKAKPQAVNKMRTPPANKSVSAEPEQAQPERAQPEAESAPVADDFTTIPGIGKATARALVANGITTFEQLKAAGKLEYLSPKARQAIEDWFGNT